jgi:hypothetical protein
MTTAAKLDANRRNANRRASSAPSEGASQPATEKLGHNLPTPPSRLSSSCATSIRNVGIFFIAFSASLTPLLNCLASRSTRSQNGGGRRERGGQHLDVFPEAEN